MKRFCIGTFALLFIFGTISAAQAQLLLRGDASYWVYGDRVRVNLEDITNYSDQTTGRLRLMVWASRDRWEYFDRGRLLGYGLLPRLLPGQNLSNVRRTMDLNEPRTGWYYITVTLEERVPTARGGWRWTIRDRVEFDQREYFWRAPEGWPFPF